MFTFKCEMCGSSHGQQPRKIEFCEPIKDQQLVFYKDVILEILKISVQTLKEYCSLPSEIVNIVLQYEDDNVLCKIYAKNMHEYTKWRKFLKQHEEKDCVLNIVSGVCSKFELKCVNY